MKTILIAALLLIPQTAWTQTTPSFGGATVGNLIYATGTAIRPLRLPGATGGNGRLSYALTGSLPSGLDFDIATHILFGTPAGVAAQSAYTWTATDRSGNTASLTFTIEIQNTSVCGRTPTVRDAIVAAISGVTACENVTATQLSNVTSLNTRQRRVAAGTTLRVGDFDGLTSLTFLDMTRIGLTGTLPAGLFDELVNLQELVLWFNRLTTLPGDIFRQLTSLRHLQLRQNFIRTLPDGLFEGLGPLQTLYMAQRDDAPLVFEMNVWLAEDSAGWRAMVREAIPLNAQVTVTLSDGMTTTVTMNAGTRQSDPFTDTGTPRITGAEFQLPDGRIGPTDATSSAGRHYNGFRLVARPTPPGVTLAPTALTIPEGEAATYTVVLDAAPTANVTVTPTVAPAGNVVTLSSAPVFTMTNWNSPQTVTVTVPDNGDAGDAVVTITHTARGSGYGALTVGQVVVTVLDDDSSLTSVCVRTPQVRDAIVAAISGVTACQYVTATQLSRLTSLSAENQMVATGTTLRVGDFDGLTSLTVLNLNNMRLTGTLPDGLFDGLGNLEQLWLWYNELTTLPGDIFRPLTRLRQLSLQQNFIRTLPDGLFEGLGSPLQTLFMNQRGGAPLVFDMNVYLVRAGAGWRAVIREATPLDILVSVMFSGSGETNIIRMDAGTRQTGIFGGVGDARITDVQFELPAGRTGPTDATNSMGREYSGFRLVTLPVPPGVTLAPTSLTIPESEAATYTVVLDAAPTADVTVTPTVAPAGNVVALSSNLVFTTTTWNSPQTVTVTATDNSDEGDAGVTITHTARGSGYGALTVGQVVAIVLDDDSTSVCVRTPQVRDAIVAAIDGVTACQDVTATQLSGLTSLSAENQMVATGTTLRVGDFDGLTSLTVLNLNNMGLTGTLPDGLFDGLGNLEQLWLWYNQLTTLPGDIFRPLTRLRQLSLQQNFIRTLPDGLFQGLGSPLQTLFVNQRGDAPLVFEMNVYLVSDGTGWRAAIREAAPLNIEVDVMLSSGTTTTVVNMNAGSSQSAPFADTGTPRITGARFQLPDGRRGPTDATSSTGRHYSGFRLVTRPLPPGVTLAPTALTIPEGEAATYTVVLNAAPTANVTVTPTVTPDGNVVTLSSAPVFTMTNWSSPQTVTVTAPDNGDVGDEVITITHTATGSGYGDLTAGQVVAIVLDDDSGITSVCGRTPQVRDAIVAAIDGVTACQHVTATQVGEITSLNADNNRVASGTLRVGDFDGLTSLTAMTLGNMGLEGALPAGLFDGLGNLEALYLWGNQLSTLRGDIFRPLTRLRQLSLQNNRIPTLPDGLFQGLGPFASLYLTQNSPGAAVFELEVSLVQGADGWRAAIREAAPLNVQVTVMWSPSGTMRTINMNAGTRQTDPFTDTGTPRITDVQFQLPDGSTGPTDATTEAVSPGVIRSYTGFRLVAQQTPPDVTFAPPALTITEGETATYTVVLNAAPTTDVSVTPTVTPAGNVVTLSASGLVFTATTWSSPQTVTVTATDNDFEGDAWGTITHTARGSGYNAITAGHVVVTVVDDDAPSFDATIVAPQFYGIDSAIPPLMLPAASRGDGPLTYALTGTLPDGLTVDITARRLSGTPTALASAMTYTWTATDRDGDTDDLVFTIAVVRTDVCTRTPVIRNTIVGAIPAVTACQHVTPTHLSRITVLGFDNRLIRTPPRSGDFAGLSGLEQLDLSNNLLAMLPENVFNGLSGLKFLYLSSNDFPTLPENIFADLSALEELTMNSTFLRSLPAGIFSRLGALRELNLWSNDRLTSLPAGLFSGLDALERLGLNGNGMTTLPAGLFSGLDALQELDLSFNQFSQLPEGMFDGVSSPLGRSLSLGGNPVDPLVLSVDLEQRGDGRVRARVREAAPLDIAVDWMVAGGGTTTIIIPQGRRTSDAFGTAMDSPATITLSDPEFRGGVSSGLRLAIASEHRPGVVFHPARLTVSENSTAPYTVVLNTAPAGDVTITPSVTPSDNDVSLSPGALIFTTANWHQAQSVTVTAAADADDTDDTATITYTVSGYNGVTDATLAVTVADAHDQRPAFVAAISPQTYTAGAVIPTLTLPEATSGDGDLVYRLNRRDLPAGLRYTPRTRTLSGIPTTAGAAVTLTWTVMDTDSNQLPEDANSLIFTVTVVDAVPGVTIAPTDLTVNEGAEITYTVVLATQPAGDVTVMPTVSGTGVTVSGALIFSTTNWGATQRITITAASDPDSDDAMATITHTVSGYGGVTAAQVTVTVFDTRGFPSFDGAMVADRIYSAGTAIQPLRLPESISGDGMLVYTLTGDLPSGLAVDIATRLLSGTPAAVTPRSTYTWTATDRDTDTASLVFTIEIQNTNVCGRTAAVRDAIVGAIPGVNDCQHVTPTHLSRITRLNLENRLLNLSPRSGDFAGLSGLEWMDLSANFLPSLPENIFNGLSALTLLGLSSNDFPTLPENIFADLSALERLIMNFTHLRSLPAGIFSRLGALRELELWSNERLTSLPAGLFSGLDVLEELALNGNMMTTLPAGLFSGLDALQELNLSSNRFSQLPEGMFDGISGPLGRELALNGNLVDPLILSVDLEQRGDGRGRARVREAAPLDIEVEWMVSGGGTGTIIIPQGRRTSDEFGTAMDSPATITLSNPEFRGGVSSGLRLTIASAPRPGVVFHPARLTVSENSTAPYTVVLNTAPTGNVTITPNVTPSDNDVSLSPGALIFTVANWHQAQSVTVTAAADADDTDDTATITYTVSGYNGVTAAALAVTVADAHDQRPAFVAVAISPQTYTAGAVIPTLTLPEAIGGDGDRVYRLNRRDLPDGLRYTPRTRTLSGRPTTAGAAVTLTWTVMDTDSNRLPEDANSLIFTVTVIEAVAGVTIAPTDITVNEGDETTYTVVLATEPAGDVTVMPTVSGAGVSVSGALTFSTTNWGTTQRITITAATDPDAADATATITHTVSGYGGVTAAEVTVTVFDIRAVPSFGGAMVGDLIYATGTAIRPLRLPGAIGGDGRLSYALAGTLPSGLTFAIATHLLSGMPDGVASQSTYTWTAADRDGDTDSLVFTIEIQNTSVCGRTSTLRDAIVAAIDGVSACENVTATQLSGITSLSLETQDIPEDTLRVGDFDGMTSLTVLSLGRTGLSSLPSGVFDPLVNLDQLYLWGNLFQELPGDIFRRLTSLTLLGLQRNSIAPPLPEGLFQNLGPLSGLFLHANPHANPAVFDLNVYRVPVGDGWGAMIREAAPLNVMIDYTASGGGRSSSVRLEAGRQAVRISDNGDFQITGARFEFPGGGMPTTDDTDVNDGYTGFRLVIQPTPPGVTLAPTALTIPEGEAATYTVVLDAAPTAAVSVTSTVAPAGNVVTLSSAQMVFTATNWSSPQTVTVTVPDNGDAGDAVVTITHTARGSGYGVIMAGQVVVTVLDDDADTPPSFDEITVAPQIYGRNSAIPPLLLPAASRGNDPITYDLTGALPPGLAVDRVQRTLSGTPTALASASTYTWTATDHDGDTASVTFTIEVQMTSVCGRTPQVRDAIVGAIRAANDCRHVTPTHLSRITGLDLDGSVFRATLRNGDFAGLSRLENLSLGNNFLASLPENLFNGLSALRVLDLAANDFTTLPENLFAGLSGLERLSLAGTFLRALPAGLFSGLGALTELGLTSSSSLTSLPVGIFSGLDALEDLRLTGTQLTTLPAGLFSGLDALEHLDLSGNLFSQLPEGMFDGVSGPLGRRLYLHGNQVDPLILSVDLEQRGDGRGRARVREAAPLAIEVDWMVSGGGNGTIIIPQGRRTSDEFGMAMASPATITLSNARFRGVTEATDDFQEGAYSGFGLDIASSPRPGVVFSPVRITMFENTARPYTVLLNTAPTGAVTITSSVTPSDADITLSPSALIFTVANWHRAQSVTVAAVADADTTDDTATITYAVSGYGDVTTADLPVVVTDPRSAPSFPVAAVADQTYSVRVSIPTLTLPEATAGDGGLRYTLTGPIPAGLSFDASARTLAGTPTAATTAVTLTYTVTDADADRSAGDRATLTITVTVISDVPGVAVDPTDLPVDEGAMATYRVWLATAPTGDVTVTPVDTGGVTTSGAVTFSPADWRMARTVTVTALVDRDNTDDTVTLTHTVSGYGGVTAPTVTVTIRDVISVLAFVEPAVADQAYNQNEEIPTLTLPAATGGGEGDPTYALQGDIPDGLEIDLATRTLAGTPTGVVSVTLTWTATERDDTVALTFTVTVTGLVAIETGALTLNEGTMTTYTVVLNRAPAGDVTVAPVSGNTVLLAVSDPLIFSPATWNTRQSVTVTAFGDPDTDADTVTITHVVTGVDDAEAAAVTVTVTDTGVVFPITLEPSSLTVDEGSTVTYTVVMRRVPPSDVTVTPTAAGTVTLSPRDLTFSTTTWNVAQTVAVVAAAVDADVTVTITHRLTGFGDITEGGELAVAVRDSRPTFGETMVASQTYVVNRAITPLTLPRAESGDGDLTHTLTGSIPAGLTFDAGRFTLTGTPATVTPPVTLTWTAVDSDNNMEATDTAVLTFVVTVEVAPGVTLTPAALTVAENAMGTYAVVLTTVPTGDVTVTPVSTAPEAVGVSTPLTFTPATWNMAMTVTVTARDDADADDVTVPIRHTVTGYGDVTTAADLPVMVLDDDNLRPAFGATMVADQTYATNTAITALTLPAATGGDGTLSYTLTGALPAGLTYTDTGTARTLTGAPTTIGVQVMLTYTAADQDGDPASLTFTVTVPGVRFSTGSLEFREDGQGSYTVVLDAHPGSDVTIIPSVSPEGILTISPAALTFTAGNYETEQRFTLAPVADADFDNERVTIRHTVRVGSGEPLPSPHIVAVEVIDEDLVPTFDLQTVADQTYTAGRTIPALTLPTASGGNGRLSYVLNGALPAGLTYTDTGTTRTLTGAPTAAASAVTLTYTVTDGDTNMAPADTATLIFTVTVEAAAVPGVTVDPTALTMDEGRTDVYTVVLTTEPEGTVTVVLTLSGPVTHSPAALTFGPASWSMDQTVTVTAVSDPDTADDTATITHTVMGYGSLTDGGAVTVTVTDTDIDTAPGFVVDAVADQVYVVDMAIPPLTLPGATGGDLGLAYSLTGSLPAGLTYTDTTRTLTGTPTTVAPAVTLTYTVADTDANTAATDTATLTFAVTVRPTVVTFGTAMVAAQTYISGTAISAVTLPAATGGIVPLTYALRGTLPAGLTVDVATRTLSGTPTVAVPSSVYTWTVTDSVGNMASLEFPITIHATSTCSRSPEVRDAIAAAAGDVACDAVTTNQLGEIQTLDLSGMSLDTLQSGDLADLSALESLMLNDNGLTALPEGIFDGLVSLRELHLDGNNNNNPFTLSIDLEPSANDQFRVRILEAAPLDVEVTWTDIGMAAGGGGATGAIAGVEGVGDYTGTVRIPAGQRTSEPFGMQTSTIALSAPRFSDVMEDTADEMGSFRGFQLGLDAEAVRAGVGITPRALNVPEGTSATYAVWLTTVPAGDVTVVPSVSPADAMVTVFPALTFTPATWSTEQTVTVAVDDDADGGVFTVSHAVSGYGDVRAVSVTVTVGPSEEVIVARLTDLNRVILPEVARVLSDQGISAVSRRIRQARADATGGGGARSLTVGGQSTFAGLATTYGRTLAEGNVDLKALLGGSSFVLPLNASGVGPLSMLSGVTLWGGGDYRSLSGKGDAFDWSGDLLSARVGADVRLGSDLLAGVAVSWNQVDLGYTTGGAAAVLGGGGYDVELTSVNPYVGWTALGGRLDLWATAGYGWGELEVTDNEDRVGRRVGDVTLKTVGAGGSGQVLRRGGTTLRLKGEALHTSMDVEGGGGRIASLMVEARRARFGVELAHTHVLAGGGRFVPRVEVGMRHDAGDGRTGTGAEVGGGVRYTDAAWGLTVESHGRVLLGHTGDYKDWGLGGSVRFEAGRGGRGLSLSVRPTWGPTTSRVDQVWSQSAAVTVPAAGVAPVQRSGQMDIDVGYGVGWGEEVLLVPYGRLTVTSSPARTWRVGSRLSVGSGVTLNLEGVREETAERLVNQGLRLNLGLGLRDGVRLNIEGMRQQNAAEALNQGIQLQLGLDF